MFHQLPDAILTRMRELEAIDAHDRTDGTPRRQRLRQIPAETGQFLALLAANVPQGLMIEIGTSAGYSTMWLALACRQTWRAITTFEVDGAKADLARITFQRTGLGDCVTLVEGDARTALPMMSNIAFCFLDAEKEIYQECYELIIPRLVPGGLLVADNAINHAETLQPMLDAALIDPRVDAMIVPIGKGELICRKCEI